MTKENVKNDNESFDYKKSLKNPKDPLIKKIKFIDFYLNRPVAALIVRLVFNTRVTPNGLTYFSFFTGILGAFFFSRGEYRYFILGGICAQLSSIIDGADGMLARTKNMCSNYGSHLDLFLDRIIDFSLWIGISLGAGIYFKNPRLISIGMLAAGLYLLHVNLFYITKSYFQVKDKGDTGEARAVLLFFVLIFAITGRMDIFIYLFLAETSLVNLVRLIYFISLGGKKNL
ncbi:MAG TPA: CDP-alcohol phosphatidyltransferase family protein [Candidatus Deferrimicrobium sp.]|nr:CDP-alcohol phosphatidyltransferase family protein [Candidatus Deferrimicrobium sp.]